MLGRRGAPVLIMSIYNHSSIEITKRYLSIDQDDKGEVFLAMNYRRMFRISRFGYTNYQRDVSRGQFVQTP